MVNSRDEIEEQAKDEPKKDPLREIIEMQKRIDKLGEELRNTNKANTRCVLKLQAMANILQI